MNANENESTALTMPWWVSPVGINVGFMIPMLLLIASADQSKMEGLTIRGIRFLSAPYIALGIGLLLLTALAGWLGGQIRVESRAADQLNIAAYERAALAVGMIALCAYLLLFRDFVLHPDLLFRTLTGSYRPDRTTISLSVGITSLVNVAPVFFSIYAYFWLLLRRKLSLPLRAMFIVLIGFTIFRVYAWSERLALIEAGVPLALAGAFRLRSSSKSLYRLIARLGPYAAVPVAIFYFGIGESVRSWTSTTYHQKLGFWQFVIGRFTSYYYTSLNNGAGVLATSNWPSYKFEFTLEWLHKAPLIGRIFSAYVNLRHLEMPRFLVGYGDPEFNNPSGIYGVVYDLGLPLGIIYFAVAGFIGALLLGAYRASRPAGLFLYPMFLLSFLEVFRYPYLGASRAFTWMLGILMALVIIRCYNREPLDRQTSQHVRRETMELG